MWFTWEKLIIIASILAPLPSESAMSWQTVRRQQDSPKHW